MRLVGDKYEGSSPHNLKGDVSRMMAPEFLKTAFSSKRPTITRLNDDTSWLVSIPHPDDDGVSGGPSFFNFLVDPWFHTKQVIISEWFLVQWHVHESRISSIADLEEFLQHTIGQKRHPATISVPTSYIDAVIVSHDTTDHCHKETLKQVSAAVPIFASPSAAREISSWKHFRTVVSLPQGNQAKFDWRTANLHPLPGWLGMKHLSQGEHFDSLYGGIALYFTKSASSLGVEALIYAPHGIKASAATWLGAAEPKVELVALIYPWTEAKIMGLAATYGREEGEKLLLGTKSRYWIDTHDGEKISSGILSWFLAKRCRIDSHAESPGTGNKVSNLQGAILKTLHEGETLTL
ncbi:hypothetical protein B0A52_05637 [Exophiala mesophila]|uniref:Metallo-beta-lactamase domain-containing protein n=1 Tax=Exophiala mesophila TaxID=212818 RepID=A0A0D1YZC5_EXOME|nr:uncharacterized protein PV10_09152 [Exophiala mesophila]KIV87962.1 hypothetical protein PV10_09152 [Exophiala mesophila]RVX70304.1 hypothetical protein B0A52_05637 [Exophiala mesophila]